MQLEEASFLEGTVFLFLCLWDVNDLPGLSGTLIIWSLRMKGEKERGI